MFSDINIDKIDVGIWVMGIGSHIKVDIANARKPNMPQVLCVHSRLLRTACDHYLVAYALIMCKSTVIVGRHSQLVFVTLHACCMIPFSKH